MGVISRIKTCLLGRYPSRLPHGHQIILGQHLPVHLPKILVNLWPVDAVRRIIPVKPLYLPVRHLFRLGYQADHIHAEPVNAFLAPPVHHVKHFFAHLGVIPVQVRLLLGKQMEIILSPLLIKLPSAAAKGCSPVVGLRAVRFPVPPDIVIPVRIALPLSALHKPAMFVRGVVHHQIHDDLKALLMGFCQKPVKILHGPELFHNSLIIADVITVVIIGRLVNRRHPDHVNAKLFQIIQPVYDPLQIPDPVPVTVHKTSGIDLINYCFFPPWCVDIVILLFLLMYSSLIRRQ